MSDTSQGPGWWIASDGKWYPPEQAASQPSSPSQPTPGAPEPGLPPGGPGAGAAMPAPPSVTPPAPPPPKKSGASGCIIALVVVGILIFVVIVGSIVAVTFLGKKASDTLNDAITSKPCTILTSQDASSVLGGSYESVQLKGFNSLGQVVLDNRVLPDAGGCWIRATDGGSGVQGRVAKASGGAATFKSELTKAKGTSQDQGNGVTLETSAYFSKDVDGLGDEAFCTDMSLAGSGGVAFRKGDDVYYVSITPDPNSSSSEDGCDVAVKLAKKIH